MKKESVNTIIVLIIGFGFMLIEKPYIGVSFLSFYIAINYLNPDKPKE